MPSSSSWFHHKERYSTRDEFESSVRIAALKAATSELRKARLVSVVNKILARGANFSPRKCAADRGMTSIVPSTTANATGQREQQQQPKANCAQATCHHRDFFSSSVTLGLTVSRGKTMTASQARNYR
jgi:hypothetical protein